MKILVTGSKGFVGKNLVMELKNHSNFEVLEYHRNTSFNQLEEYCKVADFVFHLAGVNRPENVNEFMEGNYNLTKSLLEMLENHNNKCPIMISSSIQADLQNPYGQSKRAGEELVFNYGEKHGVKTFVYRFPNIFGKWSKPNYNSAVATFCYNISRDLPIKITNPDIELTLVYIDDVIEELIQNLEGNMQKSTYCEVSVTYKKTLGEIVGLLYEFKESRNNKSIPDMSNPFAKKLYSTYLSFLSVSNFKYELKMNKDSRGSFTEFIKTNDRGQVSVNVSKPGITKGNHWHHTKNEKFLVVSGEGVIRFRDPDSNEIIEYFVSGEKLEVVDIPVGYTHNIENLGGTDMVTIMWVNEIFDPNNPDTFFLEV